VGEKAEKKKGDGDSPSKKRRVDMPAQKNKLSNYFGKK